MNRNKVGWLLFAPTATAVGGALLWRWVSTRQERPCPHWLSLFLETPYMHLVAGAESILNRLALERGMRVLDVGCGPGRLSVPAAHRVGPSGQVTALDLQPQMLQQAQARAEAGNSHNIQFVHGGIGTGVVPADTFERAILVTVLGEVVQKEAAMAEIYAALKPSGILSITEVLPDPHYQTYRTVRRLAQEAGFVAGKRWRNGLAYTAHFVKPATSTVLA